MISPRSAVALLKAVVPLARELGVSSLEMGDFRLTLGPAPVKEGRRPLTEEEAEERAEDAEEGRVGYAALLGAAARAAR